MLRLWGRMSSINVRKVAWTLRELDLEHERFEAGGAFGVVDTPEYRRHNPNSLVPLLEDGEFTLWESNVIVRYLCAKHALGTLCPESLEARADAERWMDWQQTTLNPAGRDAFIQLVRTPAEKRNGSSARSPPQRRNSRSSIAISPTAHMFAEQGSRWPISRSDAKRIAGS